MPSISFSLRSVMMNTHITAATNTIAMEPKTTSFPSVTSPVPTNAIVAPTARELNRLLPNRLPRTSSLSPWRAAAPAVTSSGREVPIATSVKPTKPPESPSRSASSTAPHTRNHAPPTMTTRPTTVRISSRLARTSPPISSPTSSGIRSSRAPLMMIPSETTSATARIAPSTLVRSPWTRIANSTIAPSESGASRRTDARVAGIVAMIAATPSTSVRLARLEPMMLPTPRSMLPRAAATPDTSSSGALVPNPTSTAPTTTGETRNTDATRAAPMTN